MAVAFHWSMESYNSSPELLSPSFLMLSVGFERHLDDLRHYTLLTGLDRIKKKKNVQHHQQLITNIHNNVINTDTSLAYAINEHLFVRLRPPQKLPRIHTDATWLFFFKAPLVVSWIKYMALDWYAQPKGLNLRKVLSKQQRSDCSRGEVVV